MQRKHVIGAAMAAVVLTGQGAALASGPKLNGADLEKAVAGKRVFLAVPLGGEFPLFYRADGRVDGSGEAVGLGRFLKPNDSGRWWVSGEKLCQKWQNWYDGRTFCFTLSRQGPDKLAWVRDDGTSGVARVGN
ncbi:hypothetical protein GCM10007036_23960 [Alsobacter metallidurans]|uniref:Uncharacterized protein n=1 Tax=Alsobacter metallidurans TaxID=340221 RepID=A0A917I895_9HYPH|nr:hypothetical protein [Alsobacter metallidurans]GGH20412.1 hypothetical protein GCM10007036_23960 [Alsobacter metallidurans]